VGAVEGVGVEPVYEGAEDGGGGVVEFHGGGDGAGGTGECGCENGRVVACEVFVDLEDFLWSCFAVADGDFDEFIGVAAWVVSVLKREWQEVTYLGDECV
jgi:hypothetical protein